MKYPGYVGDSIKHDIEGAKAVGWATALRVNDENRPGARLADYAFSRSEELVAWLVEE